MRISFGGKMVDVKTELTPMRMSISSREPVELMVEIENNSNKIQQISYEIMLGNEIGFDKAGRSSTQTKRFDSMKPGERIRDYFEIFPKVNISSRSQPITIMVIEHFEGNYNYVAAKKVKELTLRIDN